ncbi:hypothetical protein [uncultured Psychroserpens sp.]|uniref:hypothetical protein n=1 Tax=uncultured Psychroserpens sp. TaxID=255436 RepID=UPI002619F973|nr:hypothetical protein [uncultured Psychroserpens sp.]
MKLALCIVLMLISAKECDKNKTELSNNVVSSETTTEISERKMQDSTRITYQASTRGFFMRIWFEGDSVMISKDYNLKEVNRYAFPQEEKETFLKLLSEIDETNLPELKAPTSAHRYDGAQMAWLEITKDEEVYKTNIFDHGKPPKAIYELVEKILSIKTMLENQ